MFKISTPTFGDLRPAVYRRTCRNATIYWGISPKNELQGRTAPAAKSSTTELAASNVQRFQLKPFTSPVNYPSRESAVSFLALLTLLTCVRSHFSCSEAKLIITKNNTIGRNYRVVRHNATL